MIDKISKKSKPTASQRVVEEAVSTKLQAYYDDIAQQDIPQRFLDLLQDLDKAGENDGGSRT